MEISKNMFKFPFPIVTFKLFKKRVKNLFMKITGYFFMGTKGLIDTDICAVC